MRKDEYNKNITNTCAILMKNTRITEIGDDEKQPAFKLL